MAKSSVPAPTVAFERAAFERGYRVIAGVDEAGRGSIFGPVCVGMVVLATAETDEAPAILQEVRDSKRISRPKVYRLAEVVKAAALGWGVGSASAREVDQVGIVGGIQLSAERALERLQQSSGLQVDFLLTDSTLPLPRGFPADAAEAHVAGDLNCLSIACAAILAKQHHDALVRTIASDYDAAYQLQNNVGYGTVAHIRAIHELGPTPHHRYTFKPVVQLRLPPIDND